MQRLLTPWLVIPLFFVGILLTSLASQSIRQDAQKAWQDRVYHTQQDYSEQMMIAVDMHAALLSSLGGFFIGSDQLETNRFDSLLNFLKSPHSSMADTGAMIFTAKNLQWQSLYTSKKLDNISVINSSLTILPALLDECSRERRINMLPVADYHSGNRHLLMCMGIPDQPLPTVIVLSFRVDTLLNAVQPESGMSVQIRLSPRLKSGLINLSQDLQPAADHFTSSHTLIRNAGQWQFDWQASNNLFGGPDYRLANAIATGGYLVILLVSGLMFMLLFKMRQDQAQTLIRNEFAKRMEHERDRAQFYLDTAEVLMVVLDERGFITLANRKTIETLGYDAEELIGQHFSVLLNPEQHKETLERFKVLLSNSQSQRYTSENWLRMRNGGTRLLAMYNTPLRDTSGNIIGMLSCGEDITERRRLENAFHELAIGLSHVEGNEFFRRACNYLVEQLNMDIGFIGKLNTERQEITALTGVNRHAVFEPFSYNLEDTPCAKVLSTDICTFPENVSGLFPRDDLLASMGIESYIGAVLHNHEGQPQGILVLLGHKAINETEFAELMVTSFTPRLEAELQRMHDQEKLYLAHRILETSNDGLFVNNSEGICTEVNRAFQEISGYDASEIIGKRIRDLLFAGNTPEQEQINRIEIRAALKLNNYWSGEQLGKRKNGERFNFWIRINTLRNNDGEITHYVGSITDITREKNTEQLLEQLAFYDSLTGLPNRALLRERLQDQIRLCSNEQRQLAVLQIDLDNFKIINETLGFQAGDQLVTEAAKRLLEQLDDRATLARIGGDDFTIILPTIQHSMEAAQLAEQLIASLKKTYYFDTRSIYLGATIGISIFPDDGDNSDALLKAAETALYRAKEQQRGSFNFFTHDMNARNAKRLTIEQELRQAIKNDELCAWYQPKYSLVSGEIVGFEALLRWHHPERGIIPPLDFIPLAEETGLIIPIGEQVLQQAAAQLKQWHNAGYPHLQMAVNLSPRQFQDKELLERIMLIIEKNNLPLGCVELEITESAAMENPEQAIAIMQKIRSIGVMISIDDFGTGYSSLSYLKRFPLQTLKIDKSFVSHLTEESDDAAIITSVISLAKILNLQVVAEGVETHEQLEYLRAQGCDLAQGYLLSKPLPAAQIELLLDKPLPVIAR